MLVWEYLNAGSSPQDAAENYDDIVAKSCSSPQDSIVWADDEDENFLSASSFLGVGEDVCHEEDAEASRKEHINFGSAAKLQAWCRKYVLPCNSRAAFISPEPQK